ncbi:phage tail tape measure protein [Oceanidesulfovibrio indonesiensis]|uniref:Phage tail tape measure protein n=1 Tax=Oceanidesulfovibrio indonesiensis TaxID=54767 RepID=A0A7M3MBE1_9BACT|nr:phage tail tape measure protein [Oceanidesulfovibrio indonesiensis]TVM15066.1 phage tail tape measure protein [Oceanidesulfovibrio indonesiensis]
MAGRKLGVSMEIGASLGSTFKSTFGKAEASIKELGSSIREMESEPTHKLMRSFYKLRDRVRSSRRELAAAEKDLAGLKQQAEAAGGAKGFLAYRIEKAEGKVKSLQSSVKSSTRQFLDHKVKISETGRGLGDLSADYRRLTGEIQRAQNAQESLSKIQARHQSVLEKRASLRGQMFDMVALGAAAAAPVMHAMRMEQAQVRLKTVLNADDQNKALTEAKAEARNLAKNGLVGLGEAYDIQYALNSAGLDAAAARSASQVVAKVAKVTNGVPENVGEVIATTYNNLGESLEGSTRERLGRIGDLLTKAQLKFQIRDFGQLGNSMKEGAAGLASYNVELEQGITLLGQLNTAGLQGSRAGTALNAVLRSLGKAQQEYGIELVRNEKGQLDMIATLEQLRDATADMDTDIRARSLQKVFGDEGAKGVVPLLKQLDVLKNAYRDVESGSRGVVDSQVKLFTESSAGQLAKLTGTLSVLGSVIGATVLPGVNMLFGAVAVLLGPIADFAAKNETLTKVIAGTVVGLIGLKVASIGLGYGWTFVQGGALMVRKALLMIGSASTWSAAKVAVLGAAQKAWAVGQAIVTGACAAIGTAFRVMGLAVMSNPIGLIIGGIAIGATLLIANWSKVKTFFVNVWSSVVKAFTWAWEKIKELPLIGMLVKGASAVGSLLGSIGGAVGSIFGGDDAKQPGLGDATQAAPVPETAPQYSPSRTLPAGVDGLVRSRQAGSQTITINQTVNVSGETDSGMVKAAVAQANEGLETRIKKVVAEMFRERERTAYA